MSIPSYRVKRPCLKNKDKNKNNVKKRFVLGIASGIFIVGFIGGLYCVFNLYLTLRVQKVFAQTGGPALVLEAGSPPANPLVVRYGTSVNLSYSVDVSAARWGLKLVDNENDCANHNYLTSPQGPFEDEGSGSVDDYLYPAVPSTTPGTYYFCLQAYDYSFFPDGDPNHYSRKSVTITINPNGIPIADAGGNQTVNYYDTVYLDASASSDPDRHSLSYFWSFQAKPSGSNAEFIDPEQVTVTPDFVPDIVGDYVIKLTVSDGYDSDTDTVAVTATGEPALTVTGPTTVTEGDTVWYQIDLLVPPLEYGLWMPTISFQGADIGQSIKSVDVSGGGFGTYWDENACNKLCYRGVEDEPIPFGSVCYDYTLYNFYPTGCFRWDRYAAGTTIVAKGVEYTRSFQVQIQFKPGSCGFGTSDFQAVLTDDNEWKVEASSNILTVTINCPPNQPPTASFTATPVIGNAPLTVNFTDISTDPDGDDTIGSWAWDFDNNGNIDSTLQNPNNDYSAGTYTVKLTVTDDDGAQDSETKTNYITVYQVDVPTWSSPNHTTNTTNSISWNWNDNTDGSTYYEVWNSACTTKKKGNLTVSNWTEPGLAANTQYTRKLKACNSYGCSSCSSSASAYTSANTPTNLSADVPAGIEGRAKINWSWDSGGAQSGYDFIMYEKIGPVFVMGCKGDTCTTTSGGGSFITDNNVTWRFKDMKCGTEYKAYIGAYNGDYTGDLCDSGDCTPMPPPVTAATRACNTAPYWNPLIPDTTAQEGSLKTYDISLYVKDDDIAEFGDVITYTKTAGPGSINSGTGVYTWTPSFTDGNSDPTLHSITIKIDDGQGGTAQDTFIIKVYNTNRVPTAPSISYTSPATAYTNSTLICQASGSTDADTVTDGDVITYYYQFRDTNDSTVLRNWSTANTFQCATAGCDKGDTIYCHAKAYDGADYGQEGTAATKYINNSAPVLSSIGNKTIDETSSLNFIISGTDADSDALTYSASNLPSGATFIPETRIFDWTPTYTQAGTYSNVKFTVTDTDLADDSELITITVNDANLAPILDPIGDKSVDEDQLLTFTVYATDEEGGQAGLIITKSGDDNGSVGLTTWNGSKWEATYSWPTTYIEAGVYTATFTATDRQGAMDQETITITVSDVNLNPVLNLIGDKSVDENQLLTFTVYATDEEGDQADLTISKSGNGSIGATSWNGSKWQAVYSWTPAYDDAGNHQVTFTATDRQGATDQETIAITVNNVNFTPSIAPISDVNIIEGQTANFNVVITDANDLDNTETISYTVAGGKDPNMSFAEGSYTISDTECVESSSNLVCTFPFSWPTDYFDAGIYDLTFNVHDNYGDGDSEAVKITVVDTTPLLTIDIAPSPTSLTIQEQETIAFAVTATSQDQDDSLKFNMDGEIHGPYNKDDAECFINGAQQLECSYTFYWTPIICAAGPYGADKNYTKNFLVTEETGSGASISDAEIVTVQDKNRPVAFTNPVLSGQTKKYIVDENQNLQFTTSAADDDVAQCMDNILTYWCTQELEGAIRCTDNTFSWTPSFDAYDNGPIYTFDYYVTDGVDSVDFITIEITVNDVNRAPYFCQSAAGADQNPPNTATVENQSIEFYQGQAYNIYVCDDDGDVLTVSKDGKGSVGPTSFVENYSTFGKRWKAKYMWTPDFTAVVAHNQSKNYNIPFTVVDDASTEPQQSDNHTIIVTVYDYNRRPSLEDIHSQTVLEGQELSFNATTDDADADNTLSIIIDEFKDASGIDITDADLAPGTLTSPFGDVTITWTPSFDFITNIEDAPSEDAIMAIKTEDNSFQPQTISGGEVSDISKFATVTVLDSNRAPEYVDAIELEEIEEGLNLTFNIEVSDIDGDGVPIPYSEMLMQDGSPIPDNISYPATQSETGGYPNITTLGFSWTPTYDQGGTDPDTCHIDYPITVYAKDDIGARERGAPNPNQPITITKNITIRVINKNQDPAFIDSTISDGEVAEAGQFYIDIDAEDPDPGDTLTYSIIDVSPNYTGDPDPANQASINSTTGEFYWTPDYLQAGIVDQNPPNREFWQEYTFTVKVEDDFAVACGATSFDTAQFTVKVRDNNRQPGLTDDATAIPPCDVDICIFEQADTGNSFLISNSDADQDNTFIYNYSPDPVLPLVDDSDYGINLTPASPTISPDINFVWKPTLNQAYYNASGKNLQPYTFTFSVDDQRAAPYSDTHDVVIKIIDVNRAPSFFDMVATPVSMSENQSLEIEIKARDYDWDYHNNKGDWIKFSLIGYELTAQEVPFDDGSVSMPPFAADLSIVGRKDITQDELDALAEDGTAIDLATNPSDCQTIIGPPNYTECIQTLKMDLTDMYHHMGWHTLTFQAIDQRYGNDDLYNEDNPKTADYTLLVTVANVNRAPEAPVLFFPEDPDCEEWPDSSGCDDHRLVDNPKYDPSDFTFYFKPKGDQDNWAHEDRLNYTLYIRKIGPNQQDVEANFTKIGSQTITGQPSDLCDYYPAGSDPEGTLDCSLRTFDGDFMDELVDCSGIDDGDPLNNQCLTMAMSEATPEYQLDYRGDYEWFIRAEDDAPCKEITSDCQTLGVLTTDSEHFRFRTGFRECTDGSECRKGEICVDPEDGSPFLCKNFDECDLEGAVCYLSACPSGQVEENPGDCLTLAENPSKRKHHLTPGRCRNIVGVDMCDLPAAVPNTPQVCDGDGSNCQANDIPIASVDLTPRLQWTDSDPAENWNDYKGKPIGYPGDRVTYKLTISNPPFFSFDKTYTKDDTLDLGYKDVQTVDRFFSLLTSLGTPSMADSPVYLNFDEYYVWQIEADPEDPDANPPTSSLVWEFVTKTVCQVLKYDYAPDYYTDPKYQPNDGPTDPLTINDPSNPNGFVIYPVYLKLFWNPDVALGPDGALQGFGADDPATTEDETRYPLYDLKLQECDYDLTTCDPWLKPGLGQDADGWGYVIKHDDYAQGSYDAPVHPEADFGDQIDYLSFGKTYRWKVKVYHGRFTDELSTECPENYFKTPPSPGVKLSKEIIALQDSVITYRIDFEVTGEKWQRIKDFRIKDIYADSDPDDGWYDIRNPNTGDDILETVDPDSVIVYDKHSSFIDITWYLKDGAYGDSGSPDYESVGAGTTGSLILKVQENAPPGGFPECTWLINQVIALWSNINGDPGASPSPATAFHLAGQPNLDQATVSSLGGNVHSNASICLRYAPLEDYVSDYFISAHNQVVVESEENPRASRAEEVLKPAGAESDWYVKTGFSLDQIKSITVQENPDKLIIQKVNPDQPEDIETQEVELTIDQKQTGPCDITLFGTRGETVKLNKQVFYCDGDLFIDTALEIDNAGGYGMVIVGGNLHIKDDIFYNSDSITNIDDLASLGWIVLGNITMEEYNVNQVSDCDPYPESKWCDKYNLFYQTGVDPDTGEPIYDLTYGPLTVGPDHIVGTFFATREIKTGHINLPLNVEGSLIANDVVLERLEFPD